MGLILNEILKLKMLYWLSLIFVYMQSLFEYFDSILLSLLNFCIYCLIKVDERLYLE